MRKSSSGKQKWKLYTRFDLRGEERMKKERRGED
jgi:hypothetical protein